MPYHPLRCATLIVATFIASTAQAAPPSASDKETSRGLYVEGMRQLGAGDYAGAERACRGAHAIIQVPTTSACLGRALEGLGRLLEARDAFMEAAHYPEAIGETKAFAEARKTAGAQADALAPRIPSLTLVVEGVPDGAELSVTIDGAPIASGTARLPRKVDPGTHAIVVVSPGFREARTEVTARDGQEQRVPIKLERAASPQAQSPSPAPPTPVPAAPLQPGEASPEAPTAGKGQRLLAFVVGGVGIAGLGVGAAFGLVASSKWSSAKTDCGTGCGPNAAAQTEKSDADSAATISTVGFVAGAALVAAGLALFLMAPNSAPAGSGLRVEPSVGAGGGGVLLRGSF